MGKEKVKFEVDNAGVFIALTSMPFGDEKSFYNSLQQLIGNYKANTHEANKKMGYVDKDEYFNHYLYNPLGYCLWGSFDLAMISLVDDFSLSSRDFHPYSSMSKEENQESVGKNFSYQVMTNIHSFPKSTKEKKQILFDYKRLKEKWDDVTIKKDNVFTSKYDFIGISTFKINNGLLLGIGTDSIDLVKLCLSEAIRDTTSGKVEFLILDSLSWHEIVVLFFSDDVNTIAEGLGNCREFTIKTLFDFGDKHLSELNGAKFRKLKSDIQIKSFLAEKIYNGKKVDLLNSHVFVNTYSHFGFKIDFLFKDDISKIRDESISKLRLIPKYTIKPGHYSNARNILAPNIDEPNSKTNFNFLLGESDAFINAVTGNGLDQNHSFNFKEFHAHFRKHVFNNADNFKQHIRKIKTMPYFKNLDIRSPEFNAVNHTKPFLHNYAFKQEEIDKIRINLCLLRVSKVVRERITRMFINYNEGIQDPIMYIYYLDLKPLLYKLRFSIANYIGSTTVNLDAIHTILLSIAQVFELAHENRFQQSYKLTEHTISNLDFNGGIQQIVSSMDTIYKNIHAFLHRPLLESELAKSYDSLNFKSVPEFHYNFPNVFVAAHSGVQSNGPSLRLNYFHVFEPVIFMAEIVKEASNFINVNIKYEKGMYISKKDLFLEICERFRYSEYLIYVSVIIEEKNEMDIYLLVDPITFDISYFRNVSLYRFWFWHLFLQNASSYDIDGSINESVFIAVLLRYVILCNHLSISNNIDAPSVKLQNLWNKHFRKIDSFSKELLNLEKVKYYYSRTDSIRNIYLRNLYSNLNLNDTEVFELLRKMVSEDTCFDDRKISDKLVLGDSKEYTLSKELSVLVFFNVHLVKIMNVFITYSYENSLLERNYSLQGGDSIIDLNAYINKERHPLKFDPLGGFFSTGYDDKRNLFKTKVCVIRAMIDFSLKNKTSLLND